MGHFEYGWFTKFLPKSDKGTSSSADPVGPPPLEDLWRSVKSREKRGETPKWIFRFGIMSGSNGLPEFCGCNETSRALLAATLASSPAAIGGHQYSPVHLLRNQSRLHFPKEGYSGALVSFPKQKGTQEVNVTEDGVVRKIEAGKKTFVSGASEVSVETEGEYVGAVYFSLRAESAAPKLKELGFPIRKDSCGVPEKPTDVSKTLSDAELSSLGYEGKCSRI